MHLDVVVIYFDGVGKKTTLLEGLWGLGGHPWCMFGKGIVCVMDIRVLHMRVQF